MEDGHNDGDDGNVRWNQTVSQSLAERLQREFPSGTSNAARARYAIEEAVSRREHRFTRRDFEEIFSDVRDELAE